MSRSLVCLAVLTAMFAAATPAFAQTEAEITAARERGIRFLQSVQKSGGSWDYAGHEVGITALCTIALIENNVPLDDEKLQKSYEYVKKNCKSIKNTYDLALIIVMLTRYGDRRDKPLIRELAARLIAGQMDSGGWHYSCPEVETEKVLKDPKSGPAPKEGFGDNSCTQFAVLGLWVASRSGVNIDQTLDRVYKRFTSTQNEDGGWAYGAEGGSGPSMTSAGLFCLAVAEAHRIREAQKSGGKAVEGTAPAKSLMENNTFSRGFKRTSQFVVGMSGGNNRYFMWSIERVGVLLGLEKIGTTEWYNEGSRHLIKQQKEAGNWGGTGPGGEGDKDGLADTSFSLLFLRKANLGSDISRLLEGESEQKFEILEQGAKGKFNTLQDALAAAKAGETIRINGNGPYSFGGQEFKQDITIQAGFGYAPVLKFELGKSRLGIPLRPQTDVNARSMFRVTGGKVTLEGLRIQMDPPILKPAIPFQAVAVSGGTLRLLNCTLSEGNKAGSAGASLEAAGDLQVRNCLFVGGRAGVELVGNGKQSLSAENCVFFGNAGVRVINDAKTKKPADAQVSFFRCVFQTKDVLDTPRLTGKLAVDMKRSVVQSDWLGSNFLVSATGSADRTWNGQTNIYDVKNWVGSGGKAVPSIKDADSFASFWKGADKDGFRRIAPFVVIRQMGNFSHESNVQDWQIDLPDNVESALLRTSVGINAYLAGSGAPFDQFRETFSYTDWTKGGADVASASPARK